MRRFAVLSLLSLVGCVGGGGRSGRAYAAPPLPPGAAQCSAAAVCLRVIPIQAAAPLPGRLVVVWIPVGDDDRTFLPELGYDGPFFGNERTAVIPYAAIVPPRRLQQLPACLDSRRPECERMAGVATGYVMVLPNTGGPVNVYTASKSSTAVGRLIVGYGTQPIAPGGALSSVFPAGIAGGLAPYGLFKPPGRSHDQVVLAPQGTWFDLVSCTRVGSQCDLPYPNLN